jgi:hypothetical protein
MCKYFFPNSKFHKKYLKDIFPNCILQNRHFVEHLCKLQTRHFVDHLCKLQTRHFVELMHCQKDILSNL